MDLSAANLSSFTKQKRIHRRDSIDSHISLAETINHVP
jgi:hypothetical protein